MTLAGTSILLAEDNATNQMVATHMLESLGAEVTLAQDGEEALKILTEEGRVFDFALIDMQMPRVSGFELIRRLRASGAPIASMPMIALTAYVMRQHRAEIEDAGADGIICKPIVSIDGFKEEILALVRQSHIRRRGYSAPDERWFDRAGFDALCASFQPDKRVEFVSRIIGDIAMACEAVAIAVRGRDFDKLREATHPLVSVSGAIVAARLERLAMHLDSAGYPEDDESVEANARELLLEAERVLKAICSGKVTADL